MVSTDRIHHALMEIMQTARPARDARQLDQILKQSQSLHDRLQKIEELLARNRGAMVPTTEQKDTFPIPVDADWPVASLSRDVINSQPRRQAVGDWSAGTTAYHAVEAFHHHTVPGADEALVEQVVLQRYVPQGDDFMDATESLHTGSVTGTAIFSRPLPRDHDDDSEDDQKMRFVFLAVGLLLIFTLLLSA
jgi:hypothetical protein